MKLFRLLAASTLLFLPSLVAQTPGVPTPADQKAIDTTLDAFGSTLQKMDFDAFSTLFTDDADFVNILGMHWHGKAQIVKAHRVVFTTRYHGNAQFITEKSVALLAPNLALVTETIKMDDFTGRDGKVMTNNLFRMTMVLEKQGSRWLIRSAHNTAIDVEAAKHDPGF